MPKATWASSIETNSLWIHRKCLLICWIVGIANMQYGFDSAAVGALQAMPGFLRVFGYEDSKNPTGYGIDPTVQQLIASLLTLGSFLSSLCAGFFSRWFGRRQGLWLACVLNMVACVIMMVTTDVNVLYLGRLLLGISNGFLVTFSNVYTAEAAPAQLRGVIVALFAWWVNIGSIVGSTVVNSTRTYADKRSYRIPIGCLLVVPALLRAGPCSLCPRAPRWLSRRFFYNAGVGSASYPVATEIVSTRLRAYTVGSATSLGYVLAWLTSFCSPYFINPTELNWGAQYCYIWAASNFACVAFFYFFMPETANRSLEELDEMLNARLPVRRFKKYQCVGRGDIVVFGNRPAGEMEHVETRKA
ncbi:hypothetical protein MAPG_01336 [Magnaporthiopsis poae ATCC 64411]|uniref:Major facilitator superfamily (MFS) profile domain-containing protein n=1 Tax=Magnaporthiopsis poae (strain ATCC 64411 / 73-15) TaxID=644358 RepID=A0A0C4DNF5_MAGP6|nr:hypothetical protein MAPG_01336 [Magnaporthiopsis poae ATCC 64411]